MTSPVPPNPRRVAAGRRNRALRPPLSADARQRLRDSALRNKPWKKSRGPTSDQGKAVVTGNLPKCHPLKPKDESFISKCNDILNQLKNYRQLEMTEHGIDFVVGFSSLFFEQADRYVREQAEVRREAERIEFAEASAGPQCENRDFDLPLMEF